MRRVKRIDCKPPQEYCSIASACAHTGMKYSTLRHALDRGDFCCGIWVSVDKTALVKIKIDGIEYRSAAAAAIAIGCNKSSFTRHIQKETKKFTIKGHQAEIV